MDQLYQWLSLIKSEDGVVVKAWVEDCGFNTSLHKKIPCGLEANQAFWFASISHLWSGNNITIHIHENSHVFKELKTKAINT